MVVGFPSLNYLVNGRTHVIYPKYTGVQGGALVFFEQSQIDIEHVTGLESSHHSDENIEIARPCSDHTGDTPGA
jgi:hypothetical protein